MYIQKHEAYLNTHGSLFVFHSASGKDAALAHSATREGGSVPVQNSLHKPSLAIWAIFRALPHIVPWSEPAPIWSIYLLIIPKKFPTASTNIYSFPFFLLPYVHPGRCSHMEDFFFPPHFLLTDISDIIMLLIYNPQRISGSV